MAGEVTGEVSPEHALVFIVGVVGIQSKERKHGWALSDTVRSPNYHIIGVMGLPRAVT